MQVLEYDPKSATSIYEYSKKLVNKTLRDFIDDYELRLDDKNKGDLGNLVEKYFFKLAVNNKSEADFKEAGLELKTTGLKKLSRGGYTPKERLVLGMIDYHKVVEEKFHDSHLLDKVKYMLLLFYLFDKEKASIDRTFIKNILWKMSDIDFAIMKKDWETVVDKIRDGRAHELSESDTLYLGACTKGSKGKNRTSQPFSKEAARPRAFAFKQSYLKTIFISGNNDEYESVLKDTNELDINKYVANKLNIFIGRSFNSLYEEFGNGLNLKAKNIRQLLVYRMLGVKKKHIEEFVKAGIITKVVRIKKNGTPSESISFPAFKALEIINQDWEDSDFKTIIESKFLFLIYQDGDEGDYFKGFKLWSMPYEDRLESERVWNDTVDKIRENNTNFLKISQTNVAHVRPHATNNTYVDELPNGETFPKKCFWFNSGYIKKELSKSI